MPISTNALSIDSDGNGLIAKDELVHYTKGKAGLTDKEIKRLFPDLDIGGSGGVDFALMRCLKMTRLELEMPTQH